MHINFKNSLAWMLNEAESDQHFTFQNLAFPLNYNKRL